MIRSCFSSRTCGHPATVCRAMDVDKVEARMGGNADQSRNLARQMVATYFHSNCFPGQTHNSIQSRSYNM